MSPSPVIYDFGPSLVGLHLSGKARGIVAHCVRLRAELKSGCREKPNCSYLSRYAISIWQRLLRLFVSCSGER